GLRGQRPKAALREQQRAEKQEMNAAPNRAAMMVRALRDLDLSPQQRRAMREIRDRHDARVREIGRRFLDGRRRIDELLFADTPSVDRARTLARELSALSGERVTQRTLIELELFQALTPEQRAELRRKRDAAREAWLRRLGTGEPKPAGAPSPAEAEP